MKNISITLALAAALTACASTPIADAAATDIPKERIIDSSYLAMTSRSGQVTIKRDSGFGGSGCSSRLFLDGKPLADIKTSEKIVLHLPVADYVISAQPNGLCGGGVSEIRALVAEGAKLKFRVGYGSAGDFSINPTAF